MPRYRLFGKPEVQRDATVGRSISAGVPEEFWTAVSRRRRRHAMEIMVVCLAGLAPWTIYLALTLPSGFRAHYWRLAWSGFDVLLLLAMAGTAYLGWRRRQAVIAGAVVTATLLVCDAWFDIALDLGTKDVWTSVASAVFVELPLAAFFVRRAQLIVRLTLARVLPDIAEDDRPPGMFKLPLLGIAMWERELRLEREEGLIGGADPDPGREPEL
ncbi:MAG TPA: hypothetical protein VFU73_13110 [Actinocrinis sp.]|nr:hypothetical protein [Actinocrinis sp.]